MNYEACVKKLYDHSFFIPKKMNLEFMEEFSKTFHAPEKTFPSIHVAGTNGKGSVICKIASTLGKAGYRVGTYTSPHISSFRERICINGDPIPQEDVTKELNVLFSWLDSNEKKASFFEILTMLSFLYFSHQNVDVAIIETGMGGRLDSTNIVIPILSIITRIAKEHSQYLGDTLDKIASEKAGIIKSGIPSLLGKQAQFPSIMKKAIIEKSPIRTLSEDYSYQKENEQIASKALDIIADAFPVSKEALSWGLAQRPKCRLEKHFIKGKEVIFDVSHNPDGIEALFKELSLEEKIPMILGLSSDKEMGPCLDLFFSHASHLYLIQSSHHRMRRGEDLAEYAREKNISHSFVTAEQVPHLGEKKLLISGSFFFMSEIRQALGMDEPYDRLDLNGPKLK